MNVIIRNAETSDAEIIAILSKQLGYDMNIVDTSHYIDKISQSNMDSVVVATVDNEIVGWLHVLYALRIETRPFAKLRDWLLMKNIEEKASDGN
jgi:hypothetical protein